MHPYYLAFDLNENLLDRLKIVLNHISSTLTGFKSVPQHTLHATAIFIGDKYMDVDEIIQDFNFNIDAKFVGLRRFGKKDNMLVAEFEPSQRLELETVIKKIHHKLGIVDQYEFRLHITLGKLVPTIDVTKIKIGDIPNLISNSISLRNAGVPHARDR